MFALTRNQWTGCNPERRHMVVRCGETRKRPVPLISSLPPVDGVFASGGFSRAVSRVTVSTAGQPQSWDCLEIADVAAKEAPRGERLPGIAAPKGTRLKAHLVYSRMARHAHQKGVT